MKFSVIVVTLLSIALMSASPMPAAAASNTGGSLSAEDKAWCEKLQQGYQMHLRIAARAPSRLSQTNALEDAMELLNEARRVGCPWAKTATIPW